ncbi:hypothetical protein [Saccharothrix violaceirubra]|uniref:Mce-associated membrane protein n=1 Tax=Saccharothrix violaceirubra TaxID=413306 RepID=A0A7W7WWY9_9PSEU|nr:hypothetical protein [Saccharothrix violaceirubra]MBB4966860.1 hypothetical protein [Saccharothrix violaceirubra]
MPRFQALATVIVVAIVLASCGPAMPTDTPHPTTTTETIDATTAEHGDTTAGQAALTAYRGMWKAFASAGTTADWTSPELARYAGGTALSTLTTGLRDDRQRGVVYRGEPTLHPEVVAAAPTSVIVEDCGDSTNWTSHDAATGDEVDREERGRRRIDAVVELQGDGQWRVTDFGVQAVGSC